MQAFAALFQKAINRVVLRQRRNQFNPAGSKLKETNPDFLIGYGFDLRGDLIQ
jgi:hypothetical protein